MLKLKEKIVYGTTGVCVVDGVEKKKIGREVKSYYVLKPVSQSTSTVYLPTDNELLLAKARCVLSADEVKTMLDGFLSEPDMWVSSDAERRVQFNEVIASGDRKACLSLVKTLLTHQTDLSSKGKRLHISDERALKEAQRLVCDEFAVALEIDPKSVEAIIRDKLK